MQVFLSSFLPNVPQKTCPSTGCGLELLYPILDVLLKCRQIEDVLNVDDYRWVAVVHTLIRSRAFNMAVAGSFAPFVPHRGCPHVHVTVDADRHVSHIHPVGWERRRGRTVGQQTASLPSKVPRPREVSGSCS